MTELTSMMNIGKKMEKKLITIGIDSPEKLIAEGSRQAFLKLKETYPSVCLVHLYALEGAIQNTEFNSLSEKTKKRTESIQRFFKKLIKDNPESNP